MNTFLQSLQLLLGLGAEPKELTFLQVSLRGVIVFFAALVMVRLASKRSFADKTAFDTALMVVIASALARAVNGSAAFFPTLGAGFVLVILHRILAAVADFSHPFGVLIKGQPAVLVQNGRLLRKSMLINHISEHDLEEDMRLNAATEDLSKIKWRASNAAETSALSKLNNFGIARGPIWTIQPVTFVIRPTTRENVFAICRCFDATGTFSS